MSARAAALALALAVASPAAADCLELPQLLRATRLEPSLVWVSPLVVQIIASGDDAERGLSPEEVEHLGDAARDAYAPMALADDVEKALAARCNAKAVAGANAFFRSPLGVKIVRGGMELLTRSYVRDQGEYYRKLFEEGVSSGRLETARSIKPATLVYALTPRIRYALFQPAVSVLVSRLAAARHEPAPDAAALEKSVAESSALLRPYFDQMTDLAQLFSTRDLSEAELLEYRGFLGSFAGVWYRDELQRAFESAVDAAGKRFIAGAGAAP